MKILRLDLKAFGPFTNLQLDLSAGKQGLHVIYGANEAGKSTALRALQQLLFKIAERGGEDFLHPGPQLRLGAKLQAANGATIEFWRRRSRKTPVYESDDATPLDEARLAGFLGGLDENLFGSMFALSREKLELGGKEILESGGKLGQLLFAAGSGIADLRSVQKSLENEFADLFKSTGRNQKIVRTLAELAQTRERLNELQLSSEAWQEQDQALTQAENRREQLQSQADHLQNKSRKLQRLRDARPLLARRQPLIGLLQPAAIASSPGEAVTQAVAHHAEVHAGKHDHGTNYHAPGDDMPEGALYEKPFVRPPLVDTLISQAEAIDDVYRRLGEFQRSRKELPRVAEEQRETSSRAVELWHSLGKKDALPAQLDLAADIVRDFRELAQQFRDIEHERNQAHQARELWSPRAQQLRDQFEDMETPVDVSDLKQTVRQAQQRALLDEELATLDASIKKLRQQIDDGLAKLELWHGNREDLVDLNLPALERIDDTQQRLYEIDAQLRHKEKQITDAESQLKPARARLAKLGITGDIPTQRDLERARQSRDRGWRLVLASWKQISSDELQGFVEEIETSELAAVYQQCVAEADRIADRLRELADQQARHAELFAHIEKQQEQLQTLAEERDRQKQKRDEQQQQWLQLWSDSGITPKSPAEMKVWAGEVTSLKRLADTLEQQCERQAELAERVAEFAGKLEGCLARFHIPAAPLFNTLSLLLEQAQEQLDRQEKLARDRLDVERELNYADDNLNRALDTLARCEDQLKDWNQLWADVLGQLGLPAATAVGSAQQHLDTLQKLAVALHNQTQLRQRLLGLEGSCKEFEGDVARLREHLLPGLDCDAAAAVAELYRRLQSARDLFQIDQNLEALAGEIPLAEFMATAGEVEPGSLDEDIAAVEKQLSDVQRLIQETDQTIGMRRKTLADMNGNASAANMAEEAELLAAQARSQAHDFFVYRLAAGILQTSIERYRQKNEGPVVRRASELFRTLTVGSFDGLDLDSSDKGEIILRGIRAAESGSGAAAGETNSRHVLVNEMSDGTRDQLYLALRLASLEVFLKRSEPMPIVLDDLLLNFDDGRACAALETLGDLSAHTQILFFTHHQHLVELAKHSLPADRVFFHTLPAR